MATSFTTDEVVYSTDPWGIRLAFLVLDITVTCAVLLTNSVVLHLVLKVRKRQSYIVSLLVANLSAGLLALPFAIVTHFGHVQKTIICQIFHYFIHMAECAEVYSLVAIAVDRYQVVISRQLDGSSKSKVSSTLGVALIWTSSLLYSVALPFLYEHRVVITENGDSLYRSSECAFTNNVMRNRICVAFDAAALFVAPLIVISAAYAGLLIYIKKESRSVSVGAMKSRKKVVRTVLILVGIFVTFNLPLLILDIYIAFGPGHVAYENAIQAALECSAMLNFCVNPFVYALMSSTIKLKGCLRRGSVEAGDSDSGRELRSTHPSTSKRMVRVISGTYSTVAPTSANTVVAEAATKS
jgi:hypothetical protein